MTDLKKLMISSFVLLALSMMVFSSCLSPATSITQIGSFIGLTGNIAVYGESQKKGIDLAVEEINASDYIGKGKEIKVIYTDTGASEDGAVSAIQDLMGRGVSGLIGPTLSSQAFAADPLAQKDEIPLIGISNTVPGIVEMGNYIFRCSLPESSVIANTLKTAAAQYNIQKAGILWGQDEDLTVAGRDAFISAAGQYGIEILDEESFNTGDADFQTQLNQIISLNPEAICVAALADDAVNITVQMRNLGYKGLILGNNGFNSSKLILQAGESANGIIVGTAWNKDLDTPQNHNFTDAFEKKFGSKPDQFAAQSYTAVWLYAQAISSAGSSNPAAIRDALAGIRNLETPLGEFSFTENREPVSLSAVQIIQNGEFIILTQ